MQTTAPILTAQHIVDLFTKHPEVGACRRATCNLEGDKVKSACASGIIALDAGLNIAQDRTFPKVAELFGIADEEDVIGLAHGFDGRDLMSCCLYNQTRRDLYLIGREAAELMNLPVPSLDTVLTYFKKYPCDATPSS